MIKSERIFFNLDSSDSPEKRSQPLLITELCFDGQVENWSSNLQANCTLSLEVACFNQQLYVWEPLLEPVQKGYEDYQQWNLVIDVCNINILSIEKINFIFFIT